MADRQPVVQKAKGAKERLQKKIAVLDDVTCQILETMVEGLSAKFQEDIAKDTDIADPVFARNFRQRLQIHHATHEEAFKKKTFEFAFKAASIAAGRKAEMDENDSSPGYDIIVNGTRFSLKTEAGKSISPKYITISKLMEARWMRECQTPADFHAGMTHLIEHFSHYERVVMLRAIRVTTPFVGIQYSLVEIPMALFMLIGGLVANEFAPRGAKSGGSSAKVKLQGKDAFSLRLDGSVEKVTITRLDISLCKIHASWIIQTKITESKDDEE